jgi:hypothetical protein
MCGVLSSAKTLTQWFEECGEVYFRLVLNYAAQALFLIGLYQLVLRQLDAMDMDECSQLEPYLFIASLMVFFATVLVDIEETYDLMDLVLFYVPTTQGSSRCLEYAVGDDGLELVRGGMSKARKASLIVCVLLPKFVIAATLLVLGGNFLASAASNADVLLNALATNFITDLDELIFSFLTPRIVKGEIETLPAFTANPTAGRSAIGRLARRMRSYIKVAITLGLVGFWWETAPVCKVDSCEGAIRPCPLF